MDGCLRYRGQCFSDISGSSHIGSFRKDPEQCSLCKDRPPSHTSSCRLRSHARWHLLLDLSSRLRGGATYTALFHRHILRLDTVSGLLHRESNHTCHGEVRESADGSGHLQETRKNTRDRDSLPSYCPPWLRRVGNIQLGQAELCEHQWGGYLHSCMGVDSFSPACRNVLHHCNVGLEEHQESQAPSSRLCGGNLHDRMGIPSL